MRLTRNLSQGEVIRGSGYNSWEEVPGEQRQSISETAEEIFQPIREAMGKPVFVLAGGGIRSHEMNDRVGGAKRSQHLLGTALDLRCTDPGDTVKLYDLIIEMQSDGRLPHGGAALYLTKSDRPRFVHVDRRGRKARWNTGARSRADW
tara:strand:- start:6574 stop:7017 length:444 start_codon:yes stop_codon:yes gene_type:complete